MLLIDQLDAVSAYSGRIPDSFDAVAELLDQTTSEPNVKVVLAVRTVDMENDPRMQALVSDEARVATLALTDLDLDDVRVAPDKAGVDTSAVTETTLQLLAARAAAPRRVQPAGAVVAA